MNKKGFTLIELIIVIVIVGILSVIAVPVYRGYIEKAIMSEGKTLLGAIGKAELAYHIQHRRFLAIEKTGHSADLDVDARGGKYFNSFYTKVTVAAPEEMLEPKQYKSSINKTATDGGGIGYEDGSEGPTLNYSKYAVYMEVYGSYKGRPLVLSATQLANGYLYIGDLINEYMEEFNNQPDEPEMEVC